MTAAPILPDLVIAAWALAALGHGLLALDQLRAGERRTARRALVTALALTALWALAAAGLGARDVSTRLAEGVRSLAWLGFMAALVRREGGRGSGHRSSAAGARVAVGAVYGAVAAVVVAALFLSLVEAAASQPAVRAAAGAAGLLLRMMAALTALVLTQHLHRATAGRGRGGLRLVVVAVALLWGTDLLACAAAWALGGWPPALLAARGSGAALLAPVLAVAAHRDGEWALSVSRALAWRSLRAAGAVAAVAVVLGGAALAGDLAGPAHARIAQTAWTLGASVALLTLLATPASRGWVRVKVAKHLFRHRYDYRAEWLRFTDTLAGEADADLGARAARAMAELVDAPAALLLAPDGDGLAAATGWRWDGAQGAGADLARRLAAGRIVDVDAARAGTGSAEDADALPGWLIAHPDAWAVAPLIHAGRLAGAVALARPPGGGALDWEELDLLRICGRQAASHLAEARARDALAEARRFDEFSRRFAFIVHDVKNLASQVGLVARNAERHAEDPAFRADMVETLREAAGRMNALLARLAQAEGPRGAPPAPTPLLPLAHRVARRRRAQHAVTATGDADAWAMADAGRLERLLDHLVQNAVEASRPGAPVVIEVGRDGGEAVVAVTDRGCGMSAAFVRGELFRAWSSTKPDGFGIGAFEARQLAESMGGRVNVESREGEGTRFAVRLPLHDLGAPALEAAA